MKQYLLSIYQPDGDPPPPEVLEQVMREVEAWTRELKAAGAWVFAGGLHPPSTATVVRLQDGELLMTDGPFAEGKEHIGGFTIIKAPDLDAALEWGRKFARAVSLTPRPRPPDRGAAVPGRSRELIGAVMPAPPRPRSSVCSARSTAARWPSWSASSATSTSPRRRSRTRSPRRCERWPASGLPPSPAGWIITTARNRAIDRLRREASREDRHAQAALLAGPRPAGGGGAPCATTGCA